VGLGGEPHFCHTIRSNCHQELILIWQAAFGAAGGMLVATFGEANQGDDDEEPPDKAW